MKLRTILALVLVATLVLPGIAVAVVVGSPDLAAHLPENRVIPGEGGTLDVVVVNSGDLESGSASGQSLNAEVTTARGLTVRLDDGGHPVTIQTGRRAVGSLSEGGSATLQFDVSVDEDAEPGTYRLPVEATYTYTSTIVEAGGGRDHETTTEDLSVRLRVVDQARFEIVDVSHDAQVGGDGDLAVTVRNAATERAVDASATVEARNAATTFGESQQASRHVGTWPAGENRTLTYELTTAEGAETAPYDFDLAVGFEDAEGVKREDAGATFGVTPTPEQSFALANARGDLAVGDGGTLEVDLVNQADRPVDDVVLRWTGEQTTVTAAEREYALGRIGPGERATAAFEVEVSESARSGPRLFTFQTSYRNDDGDRRTGDDLDVRQVVGPETDVFDVSIGNASLAAGGTGLLEVTVTNARETAVSDVSAKLFADSPISTTDDQDFVQSLEPGETTTMVFGVGAAGSAIAKSYPVSLDFRYDEVDGDTEMSDTYRLPVRVDEPENGGGLPVVPIAVVLVIVVAVGGYYRFRR